MAEVNKVKESWGNQFKIVNMINLCSWLYTHRKKETKYVNFKYNGIACLLVDSGNGIRPCP